MHFVLNLKTSLIYQILSTCPALTLLILLTHFVGFGNLEMIGIGFLIPVILPLHPILKLLLYLFLTTWILVLLRNLYNVVHSLYACITYGLSELVTDCIGVLVVYSLCSAMYYRKVAVDAEVEQGEVLE